MDDATEALIQTKNLNAPRVTPQRIESIIAAEYYTTADKALHDCPRSDLLRLLTICIIETKNGFTVVGTSGCASPENFDAEVGMRVARQNAVNQLYVLEGYLLRQQLHERTAEHPITVEVR